MTQQEFEDIYNRVRANLIALARQFCRSAAIDMDAEDIVQEALMAFWELSSRGYPVKNPQALLITITKNICITRYRKRRVATEPLEKDIYSGTESALDSVERMDEQIIKERLYQTLSDIQRRYMLMKSSGGMSLDEIAKESGAPKANIKSALSKAKKRLKEGLKLLGYGN